MNSNYPNIKQSIVLLVLIILFSFLAGFVFARIMQKFELYDYYYLSVAPANIIVFGSFLVIAKKKAGRPFKSLYPFKPFNPLFLIPLFVTVIGLSIIISEIDNITRFLIPMPEILMRYFLDLTYNSGNILQSLSLLGIVAPFTEELLFRGLILQGFLSRHSVKKSVIVSSLLFALIHLNPWQFFSAFLGGIVLAHWFLKYGSLIPCITGHCIFNVLSVILINVFHIEIKGYTTNPFEHSFQPVWLDIAGVVLLSAGLFISVYFFKVKKSNSLLTGENNAVSENINDENPDQKAEETDL